MLLAISVGVFAPAIPLLGNPSNLTALLLLSCLIAGGRTKEMRDLLYGILLVASLAVVATLAGLLLANQAYVFNPNPFVVFLRIQICYLAIRGAKDVGKMQCALLWIGVATSAFSVGQFFLPSFSDFTRTYYLAAERITVFESGMDSDAVVRVIGPYENPSSVALVSILLLLFAFHLHSQKRLSFLWVLFCSALNILAGLFSLSKLFFITAPLLLIQLFALGYRRTVFMVIVITMIAAEIFFKQDNVLVDVVRYAMNAAVDPTVALEGRYLGEQLQAVFRSPIFGYGFIELSDVVINDSAYLSIIYLIGGFGFSVLGAFLAVWVLRRRSVLPATFFLTVATIMVAGIGANSILGYRLDIFLSALCSVLYLNSRLSKPHNLHADHRYSNV
ncbi:MAG: hypothetical protein ACOH1I_08410 [Gallionellaceae bacterium]